MTSRSSLIQSIQNYQSVYQEEQEFIKPFVDLLSHPRAFYRDHLPGHITASSWIIDHSRKFTLLTHHAKLNRWLQPGGHADGDENTGAVALREAQEETGLTSLQLMVPQIFDIDIHRIPARKDFQEHFHYDIRFCFQGNRDEDLIITDESKNLAWIPLREIAEKTGNNLSILRMAEKVKKLSGCDQQ